MPSKRVKKPKKISGSTSESSAEKIEKKLLKTHTSDVKTIEPETDAEPPQNTIQANEPDKASDTEGTEKAPLPASKTTCTVTSLENEESSTATASPKDNKKTESSESQSIKENNNVKSPLRQMLLSPKKDSETVHSKRKNRRTKSKEKATEEISKQPEITKFYAVRRSQRKCKSLVEEEKRKSVEEAVFKGLEDGIEVRDVEGKGRGVFAVKTFERGDFICEYAGEQISVDTAKQREAEYSENRDVGCYMYYFSFNNKKYCVDATKETGRLGRLLNHSIHGNCTTKLISIKDMPYLTLVAKTNIHPDEELLYDYGERNKGAIASHPWLQS